MSMTITKPVKACTNHSASIKGSNYFFLYPAGHFGAAEVTFLVVLPLMQVIVTFFAVANGEGEAFAAASEEAAVIGVGEAVAFGSSFFQPKVARLS